MVQAEGGSGEVWDVVNIRARLTHGARDSATQTCQQEEAHVKDKENAFVLQDRQGTLPGSDHTSPSASD